MHWNGLSRGLQTSTPDAESTNILSFPNVIRFAYDRTATCYPVLLTRYPVLLTWSSTKGGPYETPRFHRAYRRRGSGVAAGGVRAAGRPGASIGNPHSAL